METNQKYLYKPLPKPLPIAEQQWPEGTIPLVHTRTMTFMHENYIRDCIEGLLMQKTTFPVQVLIHDDASTDKTSDTIKEYASKYPQLIKAYYQKENTYSKKNKSEKVKLREPFRQWRIGKYEALCEGDDYWTDPYKLQKQVDFLEANPGYSLCFHNSYQVDENNKTLNKSYLKDFQKKDLTQEEMISGALIPTQTVLYISEPLKEYKPNNKHVLNGDTFLFAYLGLFGKAKYIGEINPSAYRIHERGVWSRLDKIEQAKKTLITFNEIYKFVPKKFKRVVRFSISKIHASLARKYLDNQMYMEFFKHYTKFIISAILALKISYVLEKTIFKIFK